MEGKEELEFSEHFGKNVEDFYLQKTPKVFTTQYSEKSSLLREEEDDIKKAKSLLKKRSFDLKREFPRKPMRKTKSLSNHFLVNIEELANSVNRGFDETDLSQSLSHGNEEISFVSVDDSSWPSERSSDITGTKYPKPEDKKSDQFSPIDEEEDPDSCCQKEIQNIEPAFPIYLKFNDINYKVRLNEKKNFGVERSILHGVSGSVCPGEVLALMGPSGGGKTTLLNLLSGRVKNNGGTITYNDQLYTKSLKRRIGFVLQDDVVFPHLTVKETLTYAALLRLPSTFSSQKKKERAMDIIIELGLERCQDTMIGGAFVRGISGGERKRVCIGNEILLNPSLLFLDEPTSGLDSTTALHIIQMLRNIAQAGKTVLTTIHQPSSRLFSRFDKLILLSRGCSLYFGKASEAMVYFSSIGCTPLISMNPAEFLIDLANGNIKDKSIPSELEDRLLPAVTNFERPSPGDVHEYLAGVYRLRTSNMEKMGLHKSIVLKGKFERSTSCNSTEWGASWCEQVCILFKRGFKERCHHYLSSLHIIQVISTAIIVGLLWWHSDTSSQRRVRDQAGLLFFISVFWAFFPLFTAIHTFPQERAMLAKERSVDMYKLSAYLVARNTSDLPLDLALPIIFLVVVYFMANLKTTFSAFFLTLLTVFLSIIAAQGLGLAIGAAFMDVKKATSLASVTVMAFMLSGGFFIQKVPAFMSWIRYISLNYHTYRLLLQIQYSCNEGASGPVICDSPFIKGQRLNPGGSEVGAMFMMIIGYRILTYIFLRRMKSRKIT